MQHCTFVKCLQYSIARGIYDDNLDYLSLFKVNQEQVCDSFMQVQCARSLTDDSLLLLNVVNYQKGDMTYLFGF